MCGGCGPPALSSLSRLWQDSGPPSRDVLQPQQLIPWSLQAQLALMAQLIDLQSRFAAAESEPCIGNDRTHNYRIYWRLKSPVNTEVAPQGPALACAGLDGKHGMGSSGPGLYSCLIQESGWVTDHVWNKYTQTGVFDLGLTGWASVR